MKQRPRVFVDFGASVTPCEGVRHVLICLPAGPLVLDLASHLQNRFIGFGSLPRLSLSIDGYTLHASQSLHDVLRDGDRIVANQACGGSENFQRHQPLGDSESSIHATEPKRKRRRIEWCPKVVVDIDIEIPTLDVWGLDKGSLVKGLAICGAVFVKNFDFAHMLMPDPCFTSWKALCQEAITERHRFRSRGAVRARLLKFSQGEDLRRTLEGAAKSHVPDVRYNFGVAHSVLSSDAEDWGDLDWIHRIFRDSLSLSDLLLKQELACLSAKEPRGTLGKKIANGKETWASSRLRHSLYPEAGSCTEHTDYGIVTLQQSTAAGLEAYIHDKWVPLQPREGQFLILAGDMLERLTNGLVHALRHRVCINSPSNDTAETGLARHGDGLAVRQSHILFVQPDKNTIVQPLKNYLRHDGTDLPPVRYGNWHHKKSSLAFSRG